MDTVGTIRLKRCDYEFDIRFDPAETNKLIKEVVIAVSKAKGCELDPTTIDFWTCIDGPLAKVKNTKRTLDNAIYFETDGEYIDKIHKLVPDMLFPNDLTPEERFKVQKLLTVDLGNKYKEKEKHG